MLVSIESMKAILGMPEAADPVQDPILERSSQTAQMMVEAYVGFGLEQDPSAPKTETRFQLTGSKVVRLRQYPAALVSVKAEDVTLPADQYTYDPALGVFEFKQQRYAVGKLEIKYAPGFTSDETPQDIVGAITNIALAIYENGGRVSSQSSSGALKSMTMFDAMSMSFETGSSEGGGSGPEIMVTQWSFVLDKYKVDRYVMG